jgi:hypothetical protein
MSDMQSSFGFLVGGKIALTTLEGQRSRIRSEMYENAVCGFGYNIDNLKVFSSLQRKPKIH